MGKILDCLLNNTFVCRDNPPLPALILTHIDVLTYYIPIHRHIRVHTHGHNHAYTNQHMYTNTYTHNNINAQSYKSHSQSDQYSDICD